MIQLVHSLICHIIVMCALTQSSVAIYYFIGLVLSTVNSLLHHKEVATDAHSIQVAAG